MAGIDGQGAYPDQQNNENGEIQRRRYRTMIEDCVVCGKAKAAGTATQCEDCRTRVWELYQDIPDEWKDALFSLDLSDAAMDIYEEYNVADLEWGVIAEYIMLIGVGLKSEADLRGVLVKEGKLKPDEARTLAHEIVSLYFE